MSLSFKISHLSNNTVEPRDQCSSRAVRTSEITTSIRFRGGCPGFVSRRIHLSTEPSSSKLRARCAGSDAGISGGRSVPEWTYTGSKDETFSDLEIDDDGGDGNGDSGDNGGGGDGGDDDGEEEEDEDEEADKAEEKEFGPLLKFEEVMKETERRGITLPEDMLEAAKSVGIRKLFLLRYLDLQGSIWPLGFLMRTCSMLRNRMLADPSFLFKVGTEIAIDSCCATFAEVQKRGEDFWSEFELYAADLLVGLVVDVALVGLLAPYARIGKTSVASSSTGLFKGLRRSCAALPSRSIKKSEEDVPVPPLFKSAALWGVFLGLSSNARYQIINGLERVVEGSTAAKRIPVVAMAFTVGVRFANNVYGDAVVKKPLETSSNNNREAASWSSFQMPVHYPTFTKREYEAMSEEELDRLLKLYGLPTDLGDFSCKKQFAIGAFLWEKGIDSSPAEHQLENPSSSVGDLGESSLMGLMTALKYMVHYVFRV
ncbi:hypothetical protein Bca4012_016886 [Brassica carinata]